MAAVSWRQIAPTSACSAAPPPGRPRRKPRSMARSSSGRAAFACCTPTRRGPLPSSIAIHTTGLGRGCGHTGSPSAATRPSTSSWWKRATSMVRKLGAPDAETLWSWR